MIQTTAKISSSFKHWVARGDKAKIEEELPIFLKSFLDVLNSQVINRKRISSEVEKLIISLFDIVKDFIYSGVFAQVKTTASFSTLLQYMIEIITLSPQLFASPDFSMSLWKYVVHIVTRVYLPNDADSCDYAIFLVFNMERPVGRQLYESFALKRIKYLTDFIMMSVDIYCSIFWTNVLVSFIFPEFSSFHVFSIKKYQRNIFTDQKKGFPLDLRNHIISLIEKGDFLKSIQICIRNPTTFFFFIRFYVNTFEEAPKKFSQLLRYLFDLWVSLNSTEKTAVIQCAKSASNELIEDLVFVLTKQLINNFCELYYNDGENLCLSEKIEKLISGYRTEIVGLLKRDEIDIVFFQKLYFEFSRSMSVMTFPMVLCVIYDLQVTNEAIWFFLISQIIKIGEPAFRYLKEFVIIVTINISHILLSIDMESLDSYYKKNISRQSRKGDIQNEHGYEFLNIYLNDRNQCLGYFLKDLIPEYGCEKPVWNCFSISNIGWNFEYSFMFTQQLTARRSHKKIDCNFVNFVSIMSKIQERIPICFQHNSTFLVDNFLVKSLESINELSTDIRFFDIVSKNAGLIGILNSTPIDPVISNQWIKKTCLLLCRQANMGSIEILEISMKSVISFFPKSFIIVPLLLMLSVETLFNIRSSILESFFVVSFTLSLCKNTFPINFDIKSIVDQHEESLFNYDIINQSLPMYLDPNPGLTQKTIIGVLANIHSQSQNDTFLQVFLCIMLEEVYSNVTHISSFFEQILQLFFSLSRPIQSLSTIRLFCSLISDISIISQKFPRFDNVFKDFIIEQLFEQIDECCFEHLLSSICFLVSIDPSLWNKISKPLESCIVDGFHSQTIIDFIPNFIASSHLPYQINKWIDQPDVAAIIEGKSLFQIKCESGKIILNSKSAFCSSMFEIKYLTQKCISNPPEFPPVDLDEDSIIENHDDSYFFDVFNLYFVQDNEYQTHDSQLLPLDSHEMLNITPQVMQKYPKPCTEYLQSSFGDIYQKSVKIIPFLSSIIGFGNNVQYINSSTSLSRHCSALFSCCTREVIKIGILYVGSDQTTQNEILENTIENTSSSFKEFLLSLGEVVDLKTHAYYDGKLDSEVSPKSVFYSDFQTELMFHVSPMMKTLINDDQQLLKKRHIGNDNIHIVWCENRCGYDKETITSQFNDAHIVIIPDREDLYRVLVHKKNKTSSFGPIPHDALITPQALGNLIRKTAINADRVTRSEIDQLPYGKFTELLSKVSQLATNSQE